MIKAFSFCAVSKINMQSTLKSVKLLIVFMDGVLILVDDVAVLLAVT